jgi:hypothetical protein
MLSKPQHSNWANLIARLLLAQCVHTLLAALAIVLAGRAKVHLFDGTTFVTTNAFALLLVFASTTT